eukprot:g348.t1
MDTAIQKARTTKTTPSASPGGMPTKTSESVRSIVKHHVQSFDYLVEEGLKYAVRDILPMTVNLPAPSSASAHYPMRFWIEDPKWGSPGKNDDSLDPRLFPAECKGRGMTYTAPLWLTFCWSVNDGRVSKISLHVGDIPIMVCSTLCHLRGLNPREMIRRHEDPHEFGGYFVCNGIERCIRMLQVPRRNHIMAIERPSFANRGRLYTSKATMIRSVRADESGTTLTCHYLTDGNVVVRIMILKQEFFVPAIVLLRALKETTDREIYDRLCCPSATDNAVASSVVANHVEVLLRDGTGAGVFTRREALAHLGSGFRVILQQAVSTVGLSDVEIGKLLLRRYVLVHLNADDGVSAENADKDKFTLLLLMLHKLWSFAAGECTADNADALSSQEILLSGHLYLKILKEQLETVLLRVRGTIDRDIRVDAASIKPHEEAWVKKLLARSQGRDAIGKALYYFLATGNLRSESGLDLMQNSGFTIVAEKLNWLRYIAHYRSVHRGRFFTEMKTTTVRKLLPETWGFLCCVHTPDGTPCGLLNHLCSAAEVTARPADGAKRRNVARTLAKLGMVPTTQGALLLLARGTYLPVLLDGRVIGALPMRGATKCIEALRLLKTSNASPLPANMEIAHLPSEGTGGPFPGLYLFTDAGRLVRPVQQIRTGRTEWVGPMEQQFLAIECMEQKPKGATHRELDPTNILSVVASMTPFSDMNQSPRNMYQCQMGKQTMGTPCSNYNFRTDNKMYRLQTPQVPIVQNRNQRVYSMDDHPNGTNAVVAVLAYTGYDMEDAMILNKGSFERGFAHASVYKHKFLDLADKRGVPRERFGLPAEVLQARSEEAEAEEEDEPTSTRRRRKKRRGRHGDGTRAYRGLDVDGLPNVGQRLRAGDPMYCALSLESGEPHVKKYMEKEEVVVDEVKLLGADGSSSATAATATKASIKFRLNRNPIVGDKFASRHGQKGVLSIRWRQEDMPWTESGLTPDIIINPHAYPSRMTIGMLIESMAGKAGAMHGIFQDSTPFRFHEKHRAADYFGEQLRSAGYNYYGTEHLYSGITGMPLKCHIFIGLVYYQRLRHMVSDKSQVRSTGPVNSLTMQPVKGRKRGGGVRFGEMERDSLLAHGTAFLLQDRLMNSSDRHNAHACVSCGAMLGFDYEDEDGAEQRTKRSLDTMDADDDGRETKCFIADGSRDESRRMTCRSCKSKNVGTFAMPYVVRYLANELAAMGICMSVELK